MNTQLISLRSQQVPPNSSRTQRQPLCAGRADHGRARGAGRAWWPQQQQVRSTLVLGRAHVGRTHAHQSPGLPGKAEADQAPEQLFAALHSDYN